MSKTKKQSESFLSKFRHTDNYTLLLKADQIIQSKLFFLNLLCPEVFLTPITIDNKVLNNTFKNYPTPIKQNYGLTKKIEEVLPLNLESNSRFCYEIIKFYYLPLNQLLDEALSNINNLDERFYKYKEDFVQKNTGDTDLEFSVKRIEEMFEDVNAKIVLPKMKGIDNQHSIIDLLKVYQNSINSPEIFTQRIKPEAKDGEQEEKCYLLKSFLFLLKPTIYFLLSRTLYTIYKESMIMMIL